MSLHITNGDSAAATLRLIVNEPVTTMADVLHEGPCPPVDGDAWHQVRAQFLASYNTAAAAEIREGLAQGDRLVAEACRRGDELVLWFEHDLFDQLAIIRVLDLVGRVLSDAARGGSARAASHQRVSLICIDRFPGVERFVGLGQLTAEQFATLSGTGVPVIAGHFALASDAWRAFRSPDPTELVQLTRQLDAARVASSEGGPALPFLADALLRFLAEYPSLANGLSQTEELSLAALAAGETTAGALFRATQAKEAQPFLGDLPFFDNLQRLASARVPLVILGDDDGDAGFHQRRVAITDAGRDVLAGRADQLRLNGIDLWRGGVHLAGSDSCPWRWDARGETLVS